MRKHRFLWIVAVFVLGPAVVATGCGLGAAPDLVLPRFAARATAWATSWPSSRQARRSTSPTSAAASRRPTVGGPRRSPGSGSSSPQANHSRDQCDHRRDRLRPGRVPLPAGRAPAQAGPGLRRVLGERRRDAAGGDLPGHGGHRPADVACRPGHRPLLRLHLRGRLREGPGRRALPAGRHGPRARRRSTTASRRSTWPCASPNWPARGSWCSRPTRTTSRRSWPES